MNGGKRSMFEVGESIFSELIEEGKPVTLSHLQMEVGTGYGTIKKYIDFIRYIQSMPKLDIVAESTRAKFVSIEKLPTEEDLDFMKEMYPKPTKDQEILVSLLVMKNVPLNSFNKADQKILKKLEKEKSVTIRKGKVNLTSIGTKIARGTKRIYGV